jgi:hypothetical protein
MVGLTALRRLYILPGNTGADQAGYKTVLVLKSRQLFGKQNKVNKITLIRGSMN